MRRWVGLGLVLLWGIGLACVQGDAGRRLWTPPTNPPWGGPSGVPTGPAFRPPPTRGPGTPVVSPTPDWPHPLATLPPQEQVYIVQPGDTLGSLAARYGVSVERLMAVNRLTDPNRLWVGQPLVIPPPDPDMQAPALKIIPDSELVAGPMGIFFDTAEVVARYDGYLAAYEEEVDGEVMSGARIVETVAREYSVNPRLLLALLEYESGWLTRRHPPEGTLAFPLGWHDGRYRGLWRQLSWAANELNRGFYLWPLGGIGAFTLADGTLVRPDPTVNAGTAAVQRLLGLLHGVEAWRLAVGEGGLLALYTTLFGYPFDWAVEPLLPPVLSQPPLQLPFEPGAVWYFTGGPHSAWGDGSAWAALDFAPADSQGCRVSAAWVTAVADGVVVRSDRGVVALDLDGDGFEETGWVVVYLHVAAQERVPVGTRLHAGERVGHPSCEGGVSTGTHVHLARKYNGVWIAADRELPFVLDGWQSVGYGVSYEGALVRGTERREACACRSATNRLSRP